MPIQKCKDCDRTTPLKWLRAPWRYIELAEGDPNHPVNGWRCPKCAHDWDVIQVREENGELLQLVLTGKNSLAIIGTP